MMAKLYARIYADDDAIVERSKRQRIPDLLVVKCGHPSEAGESKPAA